MKLNNKYIRKSTAKKDNFKSNFKRNSQNEDSQRHLFRGEMNLQFEENKNNKNKQDSLENIEISSNNGSWTSSDIQKDRLKRS